MCERTPRNGYWDDGKHFVFKTPCEVTALTWTCCLTLQSINVDTLKFDVPILVPSNYSRIADSLVNWLRNMEPKACRLRGVSAGHTASLVVSRNKLTNQEQTRITTATDGSQLLVRNWGRKEISAQRLMMRIELINQEQMAKMTGNSGLDGHWGGKEIMSSLRYPEWFKRYADIVIATNNLQAGVGVSIDGSHFQATTTFFSYTWVGDQVAAIQAFNRPRTGVEMRRNYFLYVQQGEGDGVACLSHLLETAEIELEAARNRCVNTLANVTFSEQKQRDNSVVQWDKFCAGLSVTCDKRQWDKYWADLTVTCDKREDGLWSTPIPKWWMEAAPWSARSISLDTSAIIPAKTPEECRHSFFAVSSKLLVSSISRRPLAVNRFASPHHSGVGVYRLPLHESLRDELSPDIIAARLISSFLTIRGTNAKVDQQFLFYGHPQQLSLLSSLGQKEETDRALRSFLPSMAYMRGDRALRGFLPSMACVNQVNLR